MNEEVKYDVRITMRDGNGQTSDDYHASVKRLSDGVELTWISEWLWLLNWKVRRKALKRAFARYDKRQSKLADVRELRR